MPTDPRIPVDPSHGWATPVPPPPTDPRIPVDPSHGWAQIGPLITSLSPAAGRATDTTPVTITGRALGGATDVTIGGASVAFVVVSDTEITFDAPPHAAGAVTVQVTTPAGSTGATPAAQFVYYATPTVTGIAPTNGPTTGGTSVTITGTNFTGTATVTFGGVAAAVTSRTGTTIIVATAPVHDPGAVHVVVTTYEPSATSSADEFTYLVRPTFTSISPDTGPTAGGTFVTITGTSLTGVTSVKFAHPTSGWLEATSVHVVDDGTLTCVSPARSVGAAYVRLDKTSTVVSALGAQFTYTAVAPPVPVVSSISPASGPLSGGTPVTITGLALGGATDVTIGGASVAFTVVSDTEITFITPAHAAGPVDVEVTTVGGTDAATFVFTSGVPSIASLTPDHGLVSGGTVVTVTGSGFADVTTVTVDGASVAFVVIDDSTLTFTAPAHAAGSADVSVTSPGGSALAAFTYYRGTTITAVAPASGSTDGGTLLTITGTGFTGATSVSVGGTAATSFTVVSDTSVTARTPPHAAGVVDVRVTTPYGGTSPITTADRFTYGTGPAVTSMSPSEGPIAGGTLVTLTGTALGTVTSVAVDGAAVAFTVVDAATITFVAPPHAAGYVEIVAAAGPAEASPPTPFLFYAPLAVTGVSPAVGPPGGGTTVTITGTGFTDATDVTFGTTPSSGPVVVLSDTTLRVASPPHALGVVDVRVATPRATSPIVTADRFTYVDPPHVTSVTPNSGSVAGGDSVTIDGSNLTGATAVRFGAVDALDVVVVDDSTITCTVPRGAAAGAVFVTVVSPAGTSTDATTYTYTNTPPVAVVAATPTSGPAVLTVQFNGDASSDTDDEFPVSYHWDFGDGSQASGSRPIHTYLTPGTYTATLTVTDAVGATATDTVEITVTANPSNVDPVAVAQAIPVEGDARLRVQFYSNASFDPDGTIRAYLWDFGDGTTSTAPNPSHTYLSDGTYTATLTVTDNEGGTDSDTVEITVGAPPEIIPAVITTLLPTRGPTSGGNAVRIKGRNLLNVEQVLFAEPGVDDGIPAATVAVVDDFSMTVIAPPHAVGFVNVRCVSGEYISTTGPQTLYEYVPPPVAAAAVVSIVGERCQPATVTFSSAGSTSAYGPITYAWNFGTGSPLDFGDNDTSYDPNPTHVYDPGTYTATLTVTDPRGVSATARVSVAVPECTGGFPGGGGGPTGGGGGGGSGGTGGGGGGSDPGGGDPPPPNFIDSTCDGDQAHIIRTHRLADGSFSDPTQPLFAATWTAQRLISGILFTAEVEVLSDFEPPESGPYAGYFPARAYIGAFSMTADAEWPGGAPSATTESEGLGRLGRVVTTDGVFLTPEVVGGLFAPLVNDGTTGIAAGARFTLSILAPPELEIAFAQVGFLAPTGYGIGDLGIAWINVDCELDAIASIAGWTISDPSIFGGGSWVVKQTATDIDSHHRRLR